MKRFESMPDWNFRDYGKLWNYHLQYLEILSDETIESQLRMRWLADLSEKIGKGNLDLEPFPVSQRIIYSLQFLARHPSQDPVIHRALFKQIAFLEDNLELHLSGNHLLENYLSLVYAHLALKRSEKLKLYLKALVRELDAQILGDGAHYELCLGYHAAIFCRLSGIIPWLRKAHVDPESSAHLERKACAMFAWMKAMTMNFGIFPLINDTVRWPVDHWRAIRDLGREMQLDRHELPLSESGYRWLSKGSLHLLMRMGPFKAEHQPGHQHADYLSICLFQGAIPILVDPGISTYEAGPERLLQKSTFMHNLVVEQPGEDQSELWSSFRMGRRAKVDGHVDQGEKVSAQVTWYRGQIHKRTIACVADGFEMTDTFERANGKNHTAIALYHFDQTLGEISLSDNSIYLDKVNIRIHFSGVHSIAKEAYRQHYGFNDSVRAERILVYFCGQLKTQIKLHFEKNPLPNVSLST